MSVLLATLISFQAASALDVRDFGARGDGASDDSPAVQKAVAQAVAQKRPLYFSPGRYLVPNLSAVVPTGGSLTVYGAGEGKTVLDGGMDRPTPTSLLDCRGAIDARDLRITRCGYAFGFGNLTSVVPLASFQHITVDNSGAGIYGNYQREYSSRGIEKLVVGGCTFSRMAFGKGIFLLISNLRRAEIHDSVIRQLLTNNTSSSVAILLGQDSRTTQKQGGNRNWLIERNTIADVEHPRAANGILVQSFRYVKVRNNTIRDVRTDNGSDCEGIYLKGTDYMIEGNRLIDAGMKQGMIALKGEPFETGEYQKENKSLGGDAVVRNNVLRCVNPSGEVRGIFINHGGVTIADNAFEGLTGPALINDSTPSNLRNVVVRHNVFRDLHTNYAISVVSDATSWTIEDNTFQDLDFSGYTGATGAVNFETKTGARLLQQDIKILRNTVSGLTGSTKRRVFNFFAYSGRQQTGGKILNVLVKGNRIQGPYEVAVAYGTHDVGKVGIQSFGNVVSNGAQAARRVD